MNDPNYYSVVIDNVSLSNLGYIIFLRRDEDERVLPIFIGAAEAHSISAALNHQEFPRPLSHDLFKSIMEKTGIDLSHIRISDLKEGTFYARLELDFQGQKLDIDSRPSDAIALALRYQSPVFVHRKVFEESAVSLQQDAEAEKDDRVEKLKNNMEKAVSEERYEDAAQIRDELKKLQSDN